MKPYQGVTPFMLVPRDSVLKESLTEKLCNMVQL